MAIGCAIGWWLSDRPTFSYANKPNLSRAVGSGVLLICILLGIVVGELAEVLWKGICR